MVFPIRREFLEQKLGLSFCPGIAILIRVKHVVVVTWPFNSDSSLPKLLDSLLLHVWLELTFAGSTGIANVCPRITTASGNNSILALCFISRLNSSCSGNGNFKTCSFSYCLELFPHWLIY